MSFDFLIYSQNNNRFRRRHPFTLIDPFSPIYPYTIVIRQTSFIWSHDYKQ
jgi:hypothetical protein